MFYEQGQMAQAQVADTQLPWWADVVQDLPGIPTSIGFTANRTANTMLYGARGSGSAAGSIAGMITQNLNPRNFFRYSTDDFIRNPGTHKYTPYGLARLGNIAMGMHDRRRGVGVTPLSKAPPPTGTPATGFGRSKPIANWGAPNRRSRVKSKVKKPVPMTHFEEGFLGRVTAAAKLNNMSAARFEATRPKLQGFVGSQVQGSTIKSTIGKNWGAPLAGSRVEGLKPMHGLNAKVASRATLMTGGRFSGFVAGAMEFTETGRVWTNTTKAAASQVKLSGQAKKGMDAAARLATRAEGSAATAASKAFTGKGIYSQAARAGTTLARGSRAASLTLKTVGYGAKFMAYASPLMTAMMLYDIGKLTTKAVGYSVKLGMEANKSYYSGLRTEIGGSGFVETESSLTSRARGVQAIQASRLNARSILGAEAGSMHSYYQ